MKKHHKISLIILVPVLVTGLALAFLPWKIAVEHRLQTILHEKGFENADVTLSGLGLYEARLQDITVGHGSKIALENLTLHYALNELWRGNLQAVSVSGLVLDLKQADGQWSVQGYRSTNENSATLSSILPVTAEKIAAVPLDSLAIDKSQLNIASEKFHIIVPLQAQWNKQPVPGISLASDDLQFSSAALNAKAAHAGIKAVFDKQSWQGKWKIQDISFSSALPAMQASGMIILDEKTFIVTGKVQSADDTYSAKFDLGIPMTTGAPSVLTIEHAAMNWKGGIVSVDNVKMPLGHQDHIKFNVRIEKLSVDELLQALTGKRVTSTGFVSGSLPVTLANDGSLSFGQGKLQSTGEGLITMPEDVIPGDSPQIQLTRAILKNFHYRNLSIVVKDGKNGDLGLLLALEGNNPDMYAGRAVKLNVNLSGDILDFVKENAMLINNPKTILRQDGK